MTATTLQAPTDLDEQLAACMRSDYGNAERLVARHGDDLRYCHQTGRWLVWDGSRWAEDDTDAAMRLAKDTVRAIYREVGTLADGDARAALGRHAANSEAVGRLTAMLRLAQSEAQVSVHLRELDTHPWLLTVANGTLNLKTGRLQAHRREDLLTKASPVSYDPDARCPRWLRFLDEVFAGNQPVIDYVQKVFGYSLTGDVSDHSLIVLEGSGANGKTTLLNVLLSLAGDYGLQASSELLLAERRDAHPTAKADLQGRRPVVASEVAPGSRFDENLVKQLAGGDVITARRMRQDFFSFEPTHTLWLAVNDLPDVRGRDHAIWRRMRRLHFPRQFDQADRDPQLPAKLTAELPGILAWAVAGARRWQHDHDLTPPKTVQQDTTAYQEATDPLAEFLDECCINDPAARTSAADLYDAYERWHRHSGDGKPISGRGFGLQLRRLGYTKSKSGRISWQGIKLTSPTYF